MSHTAPPVLLMLRCLIRHKSSDVLLEMSLANYRHGVSNREFGDANRHHWPAAL
jgi:hypothetical protein